MKVAELSGALLDYWVARADESWKWAHMLFPTMTLDPTFKAVELFTYQSGQQECLLLPNNPMRQDAQIFAPSTDWAHGGLLIERGEISVYASVDWKSERQHSLLHWVGVCERIFTRRGYIGPTPLVAAMRAFVAGKFGEEVPDV